MHKADSPGNVTHSQHITTHSRERHYKCPARWGTGRGLCEIQWFVFWCESILHHSIKFYHSISSLAELLSRATWLTDLARLSRGLATLQVHRTWAQKSLLSFYVPLFLFLDFSCKKTIGLFDLQLCNSIPFFQGSSEFLSLFVLKTRKPGHIHPASSVAWETPPSFLSGTFGGLRLTLSRRERTCKGGRKFPTHGGGGWLSQAGSFMDGFVECFVVVEA